MGDYFLVQDETLLYICTVSANIAYQDDHYMQFDAVLYTDAEFLKEFL